MTVSEAYQNGYTAKLGLSASFFSAEFGFDVTRTLTVTDSYSYRIPAGKCARIKAYMVYQDYKGDIWHHPAFDSWRTTVALRWRFPQGGFTRGDIAVGYPQVSGEIAVAWPQVDRAAGLD